MKDEILEALYIEQLIDHVLLRLDKKPLFLTRAEKLEKIKEVDVDVFNRLEKLIVDGVGSASFNENREKLIDVIDDH